VTTLYQPRGKARAYAQLALTIFHQCPHGCRYCYCPRILHKSRYDFFSREPRPRDGLLDDLPAACEEWAAVTEERPAVHLSFIGDPLPLGSPTGVAEAVINILHRFNFPVQILSKSGLLPDSLLHGLREGDSYGISLTTAQQEAQKYWEPFAGSIGTRINAMGRALEAGIKTWVSLEPVLSLDDAKGVLYALQGCSCDPVWVGPLNHQKRGYDWPEVKAQLAELAKEAGLPVRWKDEVCPAK